MPKGITDLNLVGDTHFAEVTRRHPSLGRIQFPANQMYDPSKDPRVQDLIEVSRQLTIKRIANKKLSHHPSMAEQVERGEWEKHEERVGRIRLFFFQKVTGHPF